MACLAGPALAQVEAAPPRKAFRVCQDPNNLPFSNEKGEGLENRLAEVFGKALGLPVTYYSYPQRMGFIRNTLRFKAPGEDFPCDVVMGWPPDSGPVASTKPYYQSTYAMVLRKDRVSTPVATIADFLKLEPAQLKRLRIGLYDRSPASEWLARHDLVDQGVPYKMINADPAQYAGEIIDRELVEGRIDAAVVWGPIGGYYAKRNPSVPMVVLPLKNGTRRHAELLGIVHRRTPRRRPSGSKQVADGARGQAARDSGHPARIRRADGQRGRRGGAGLTPPALPADANAMPCALRAPPTGGRLAAVLACGSPVRPRRCCCRSR